MQDSNTNDMVFKIPFLVSFVSRFMTLLRGDVICTGTPSGVGLGQKPPVFLRPGDVVELGIEKLGSQKQTAISDIQSQLSPEDWTDFQAWTALGLGGTPGNSPAGFTFSQKFSLVYFAAAIFGHCIG